MNETIYLNLDQAKNLVDRIAERTENFNYSMSEAEKEAMSEFLSDVGVTTEDLIDVARLADNYAINAEIVEEEEAENYSNIEEDRLFQWEDDRKKVYCYSW